MPPLDEIHVWLLENVTDIISDIEVDPDCVIADAPTTSANSRLNNLIDAEEIVNIGLVLTSGIIFTPLLNPQIDEDVGNAIGLLSV